MRVPPSIRRGPLEVEERGRQRPGLGSRVHHGLRPGLIGELPNFVHRPYLVVTMDDLWPRFKASVDATLSVSVHIWGETGAVAPGGERQERFGRYAELGLGRVIVQGFPAVQDEAALDLLVADCAAVGLLEGAVA